MANLKVGDRVRFRAVPGYNRARSRGTVAEVVEEFGGPEALVVWDSTAREKGDKGLYKVADLFNIKQKKRR